MQHLLLRKPSATCKPAGLEAANEASWGDSKRRVQFCPACTACWRRCCSRQGRPLQAGKPLLACYCTCSLFGVVARPRDASHAVAARVSALPHGGILDGTAPNPRPLLPVWPTAAAPRVRS